MALEGTQPGALSCQGWGCGSCWLTLLSFQSSSAVPSVPGRVSDEGLYAGRGSCEGVKEPLQLLQGQSCRKLSWAAR